MLMSNRLRLLLFVFVLVSPLAALAQTVKLTLLHTNDVYEIAPVRGWGGLAELATVLKKERSLAPNSLTTFGGDMISPSLLSGLTKGAQMIELMNAVGTDLAVLGNHEFDFGDDVLGRRMDESKFVWLATNVVGPAGTPFRTALGTTMREFGGLKFGFFGIVTPETVTLSRPGKDTNFLSPVETAQKTVKRLKDDGADVVILLSHLTIAEDRDLARRVKGIDVILGGHDHDAITYYEGTTLIHKSGSDAHWLGVVELTATKRPQQSGPPRVEVVPGWRMVPIRGVAPDPEVAAIVKKYTDRLDAELSVRIGTTTTALTSGRDVVRSEEVAIGNLIADAVRDAVGGDVGLINGGGIRGDKSYAAGTPLTRRDVITELPFGNKTVLLELKGSDLRQAIEHSVGRVEEKQGRFSQVSGMTLVYDPKAPVGKRVVEIKIGGQPLDVDKTYKVATNDYMATGGDGFEVLKRGKPLIDAEAAKLMASQVMDYIAARGTVAPTVEGRIVAK